MESHHHLGPEGRVFFFEKHKTTINLQEPKKLFVKMAISKIEENELT